MHKRRIPYIPILTGVTLAFVLASAGFIFLMVYLNNPFERVPEHEVPNLVDVKFETAVAANDMFEIVEEDEERAYNDDYAKGVIYEQKPKFGATPIKEGSTIRVKVSNGPRRVTLQDYRDKDAGQVMQKLMEEGLEPREQQEHSSEIQAGRVIGTDPSAGSELGSGAQVTVFVSIGPKETLKEVPSDLIGMMKEDASRYLEMSSLRLGNVSEQVSDKPPGTIIACDPGGGTLHPPGTYVNIVVAKEKPRGVTLTVPLPPMRDTLTVRARLEDNTAIGEATLDPRRDDVWSLEITGDPGQVVNVRVYISTPDMTGKLYQEYMVDIDAGTVEMITDNSGASIFQ